MLKKDLNIKTAFDVYTLVQQIGEGGNGFVWLSLNQNKEKVAIKFVKNNISTEKRKRFKNEIWFCLNHKHENIINVLDYGLHVSGEIEYMFYVMDYYPKTLRDKMKVGINPDDIIEIYTGLIKGLKYAHENGAIHRDIKPENILFKEDSNNPVIADFGVAHFIKDEQKTDVNTKLNSKMANYAYRAPEQIHNNGISERTDIYSATLLLNEMFTGEVPASNDFKTIGSVNPDYAFLDKLFLSIYKQNPDERLYPEDNILKDLKILIEDSELEKEKKKIELQKLANNEFVPYKAEIEDVWVKNNILSIKMKEPFPHEWGLVLQRGSFNYGCVVGYHPNVFRFANRSTLFVSIDEPEEAPALIRYFKSWMPDVDNQYNEYLKRQSELKRQELEDARREELEAINLNQKLKKML